MTLVGLNSKQQLSVSGTYTDGTSEDLTRKVQYTANDESVLDVSPNGEIRAKRAGETAIMVRTLGKALATRIAVIETPPMKDYPEVPRNNSIDEFICDKSRLSGSIAQSVDVVTTVNHLCDFAEADQVLELLRLHLNQCPQKSETRDGHFWRHVFIGPGNL